jgi:triosephosphate isomerase (TIM)
MRPELEITPPFFEIGPKAYTYGSDLIELARQADSLSRTYDVQIIITPQYVDIPLVAQAVERLVVFAQHMDSLTPGRGVGSVLPEAVKAAGAEGVLLNHVERRLTRPELARTMRRAQEVGLATMVCADDVQDAVSIAGLSPDIIIVEAPDLIAGGRREAGDGAAIAAANEAVWSVDPSAAMLESMISAMRDAWNSIH